MAKELSGEAWVARFPDTKTIASLNSPFKEAAQSFYDALTTAGANVSIGTAVRPSERAYLMYTAFQIFHEDITAAEADAAPIPAGVNIQWMHPTDAASIAAATTMKNKYGISYAPAYPSKHTSGTAIDMNISWTNDLDIEKADGSNVVISSSPKTGSNLDLHIVGKSYGVVKLVADPPHWSDDGH